jgi:uncharacterized protein (DUF58 family)
LYKARRVPTKQPVCAICADRTGGRTELVRMTHGVAVWLCAARASVDFQRQRGGRDFVLTLQRLWQAHGCLTANRGKALTAHLTGLRDRPARPRPGSYAWPALRARAEARFAGGAPPAQVARAIETAFTPATHPLARPPSARTVHRWHAQRRWLTSPRPPPA